MEVESKNIPESNRRRRNEEEEAQEEKEAAAKKLDSIDVMYGNAFSALRYITLVMTEFLAERRNKKQSSLASNSGSEKKKKTSPKSTYSEADNFEEPPFRYSIAGYISYIFLFVVGYVREFLWGMGPLGGAKKIAETNKRKGYTPLYASFESFYTRNVYRRLKDVFNRPIASVPGAKVTLVNRTSEDHFWTWNMDRNPNNNVECINLASYNYLGFAEKSGPCTDSAICSVEESGIANGSSRAELGTLDLHHKLETNLADYLSVEDAMVVGMGFATNTLNIPALITKGCLVISDEKNHASLILGLRLSGATVMVFKHNNVDNLEKILRKALIQGHPRTRRAWKKVLIVVEGVYSMEGTIVKLPEIVALKKKYGAYIYLDEAHSVGAMGPNGRGVVDYFNMNPSDIDIMMGTFTKSFGSAGGYIAGSKKLISHIRVNSHGSTYATSISAPVAQQIIASMQEIMSGNGLQRIERLRQNTRYFREGVQRMGLITYGHPDSPVVPVMIFFPSKLRYVVNGLHDRGVAVVGVGFPATKMGEERIRVCLSAGHTKDMLDKSLLALNEMAQLAGIKYSRRKYNYDED